MKTFPESSFFKEKRASALPTPAEIRAINKKSGDVFATDFNRPPPVRIPSLGLFVKYGADITVIEAATQVIIREQLHGQVPIPEVFGWTEDGDQLFIYMASIEGKTLLERWCDMNKHERRTVCHQLQYMVKAWRALTQDQCDRYIGKWVA